MTYPIYVYGAPVLRKRAKEIGPDYPGLVRLISDMVETMKVSDGVGLAAPQIGLSIRLIVIDGSEMEDDSDLTLKDFRKILINPRLVDETGNKWIFNEGCLSLPGIREDIERHERIVLEYYDEDFTFHEEEFTGIKARIIQHEYDHLEGVLFIDRINPIRKRFLNGRLQAISKGKAPVNYQIKITT